MKYLKRINESTLDKSKFRDYVENHFMEIIDNEMYNFKIDIHEIDPNVLYGDNYDLPKVKFLQAYINIFSTDKKYNSSLGTFTEDSLKKFKKFTSNVIELNNNLNKSLDSVNNDPSLKIDYITIEYDKIHGTNYIISIIENV